jgi:hypothetical protein
MLQVLSSRLLRWIGGGLVVLGAGFVGYRLSVYGNEFSRVELSCRMWVIVGSVVLGHAVAGTMLAFAWWHLVVHLGGVVSRGNALRIFGLSQLARYIPGNVFQYCGRQALGTISGIGARPLTYSILWELGSAAVAGGFLAGFAWLTFRMGMSLWVGFGLGTAGLLLGWWGLPQNIGSALLWHVAYFASVGVMFSVILISLAPSYEDSWWQLVPTLAGAYVAACLAGLIVPGAPAGLGVREAVLCALLQQWPNQTNILFGLLLARMANIVGDVLFCIGAWLACRFSKARPVEYAGRSGI